MDTQRIQHDKSMSLDQRIHAMERKIAADRVHAAAHASGFKWRTKRRATTPTALVFATSMGFVLGEVTRERARAMAGKPKGERKGPLTSLLGPVASLVKGLVIL